MSDLCTDPLHTNLDYHDTSAWRLNPPVNSPLVRLKLGLGVEGHTDRGISCCRGCWDMDLWGLGVLLSCARHLGKHKMTAYVNYFFTVMGFSVWFFLWRAVQNSHYNDDDPHFVTTVVV